MIRAFIFDIGNVLLRFDFSVMMRRLHQKSGVEHLIEAMEPLKVAYESGHMGRAEFLEKVRAVLHYTGSEAEFIAAWEDIFTEIVPMSELVRALHGRWPLYLLSNTSDLHMEDYIPRTYPVFGFFKDGVYSYRAKCFKPDRRIFEIALEQFGIEAHETVLIDDLQPNIDAALELGFKAIRYDYNRHDDLLARLRELGVEI
jgi:putative hydrolase of the HAD superfamily